MSRLKEMVMSVRSLDSPGLGVGIDGLPGCIPEAEGVADDSPGFGISRLR